MDFSTGLKNAVLSAGGSGGNTNGGLSTLLSSCRIEFYAGAIPASADAAASGVAVNVYNSNGDGASYNANFESAAVDGVLNKAAVETWSGTAVSTDTVTWFRILLAGDANGDDTVIKAQLRVQGTVGGPGSDIYIANQGLTSGDTYYIDAFAIAVPNL